MQHGTPSAQPGQCQAKQDGYPKGIWRLCASARGLSSSGMFLLPISMEPLHPIWPHPLCDLPEPPLGSELLFWASTVFCS